MVNSCAFAVTAALALWAASGKDLQLSSYAVKHTPIYGSNGRAQMASEVLQYVAVGITALIYGAKYFAIDVGSIDYHVAPYYPDIYAQYTLSAASTGKAIVVSTASASTAITALKRSTGRFRPDGSNDQSYPSGHAATAACANHASARMISGLGLPPYYAYPAYAALSLITIGTGWGRVEGAMHYPSDILAGMYVGIAFTDASFALYDGRGRRIDKAHGANFNISTANERGVTTTVLSTTVDF